MTKAELLKYIEQAVDGLEPEDLDQLLPNEKQPDLYTIVQELVGLRGEVRKLSQAALKTNHELQIMLSQQKNMLAEVQTNVIEAVSNTEVRQSDVSNPDYADAPEYQELLKQIMEQDDIMQRTVNHFQTLPEIGYFNLNQYRLKMASWQKGYEMAHQKWQQFVKSTGIYATGKVGETFDPNFHEAIAVKSVADKPHGVILESELLGFVRGEKMIRRAKVVVNKTISE